MFLSNSAAFAVGSFQQHLSNLNIPNPGTPRGHTQWCSTPYWRAYLHLGVRGQGRFVGPSLHLSPSLSPSKFNMAVSTSSAIAVCMRQTSNLKPFRSRHIPTPGHREATHKGVQHSYQSRYKCASLRLDVPNHESTKRRDRLNSYTSRHVRPVGILLLNQFFLLPNNCWHPSL